MQRRVAPRAARWQSRLRHMRRRARRNPSSNLQSHLVTHEAIRRSRSPYRPHRLRRRNHLRRRKRKRTSPLDPVWTRRQTLSRNFGFWAVCWPRASGNKGNSMDRRGANARSWSGFSCLARGCPESLARDCLFVRKPLAGVLCHERRCDAQLACLTCHPRLPVSMRRN